MRIGVRRVRDHLPAAHDAQGDKVQGETYSAGGLRVSIRRVGAVRVYSDVVQPRQHHCSAALHRDVPDRTSGELMNICSP